MRFKGREKGPLLGINEGMLTTLCFDADDTLWHNEQFFRATEAQFIAMLRDYTDTEELAGRLLEAEKRNLGRYGFGIKGFVLSMIETALDVTDNTVPGHVIRDIVGVGQDMLAHPIELLPGVAETIEMLARRYALVLITKGDLLDQERKVAQSGLGEFFSGIEIVSDKVPQTYQGILKSRNLSPSRALMTGNSMKSDILPMLEIGGWAVHVPHDLEWELEAADAPIGHKKYRVVERFADLPATVEGINYKI